MKQYKLIKEYPGSPELGEIVKREYYGSQFELESNCRIYFPKNIIENNPEFWEPIVKQDYEILRFGLPGGNSIHVQNAKNSIKFMLKNSNIYKIYQIRRLSDGEIFTIGDNTKYGCIDKFYIKNDYLLATTVLESNGRDLKDLEKIKQPLFKTEDGVDIYEDDEVVCFDKEDWITRNENYKFQPFDVNDKNYLFFSTKKAAEQYIIMNKPCLSINDVMSLTKGFRDKKHLEELVKQKIIKE